MNSCPNKCGNDLLISTLNVAFIHLFSESRAPCLIPVSATHLKRAPESKREWPLEVPLFRAPALAQFVVTDHNLFAPLTEAGVDVKGNVVASQKVHCKPVGHQAGCYFFSFCVCFIKFRTSV